ncbi:hypothetical protein CC78DRAFT_482010, partial [Lojkania enalia]
WVSLPGFIQGAKLSACLLFDQQVRVEAARRGNTKALMEPATMWKFGVLLAGSAPLVSVPAVDEAEEKAQEHAQRIPTVHVHELEDPRILLHRRPLNQMDKDTVTLVEWDDNHRALIKTMNVGNIVESTMNVASKTGEIT